MSIYRSSGKNTEIYEEYELYTRQYVENVGGSSNFTAKEGTIYGDEPKTAKPLELTNLYVKVRLGSDYDGEFGFDWVDVNPETKEIEKIQGVPFSELSYFYKEGTTKEDLGSIVEKYTDEIGAKHIIQDHYRFNPISKHIDIPYVLIKPEQKITLSVEVILWKGKVSDDIISITGDEFYDFEIVGGEKEGKTAKKKLKKAGKFDLKIKCLKAGSEKMYDFNHSNPNTGSHVVGGLIMMENEILTLKFRVIAVVSSAGNPIEKSKNIFRNFKDSKITDFLNEKALNQAGYKVVIENEQMFKDLETTDVDDFFYAFDKEDWKRKNLFSVDENRKKFSLIKNDQGEERFKEEQQEGQLVLDYQVEDGTDSAGNKKYKMQSNDLDETVSIYYADKLKSKAKEYKGGLIILSDFECSNSSVAAFSRMFPVNHYGLFVAVNGHNSKNVFAHELGHMLGLAHIFVEDVEKDEHKNKINTIKDYKNRIEKCKGDIAKEKISNQVSDKDLKAKPLKNQSKVLQTFLTHFVQKQTLEECLNNTNIYLLQKMEYRNEQIKFYTDKANEKKEYSSYSIAGKVVSKAEFKDAINTSLKMNETEKKNLEKQIESNNLSLKKLSLLNTKGIFEFDSEYFLINEDKLKIYEDYLKLKLEKDWEVIKSNYVYFNFKSTENIMDYGQVLKDGQDSVKKNKFLSHQIIIMRNDYENYK